LRRIVISSLAGRWILLTSILSNCFAQF
jgi:hypothetical protein